MKFKDKKNYKAIAIQLENYVNNYIPPSWKEPIKSVAFVYPISAKEAQDLYISFMHGNLEEDVLKTKPWYIHKAIRQFFLEMEE